jgi:signal transduction histidine kinase
MLLVSTDVLEGYVFVSWWSGPPFASESTVNDVRTEPVTSERSLTGEPSAEAPLSEEALLQELDRLVTRLAHDVRGPLHVVSGYADLLAGELGSLTPKQGHYVEIIRTGTKELQRAADKGYEQLRELIRSGISQRHGT